MLLLRSIDYRRMPWKNGGGETAEIAVWPPGASLDAFEWRLSMARVDGDGPFSSFAGVDRTLAIVAGAGMRLHVAGQADLEITAASMPCAFPADIATSADLLSGPVIDLNIMTRRGRFVHRMTCERGGAQLTLEKDALTTFIVCASGAARVEAGETAELGPHDTVRIDRSQRAVCVYPAENSVLLLVDIRTA